MSSHNSQEPMDPGDLERKHRVFLCHSGAQKGFVEQLDKDLRRVDRYPFFDKDRESLPIGDNFPILIFEAIQRCQVGVVVLSKEFFARSQWPMFELVKMVECRRRIIPIFLGISPEDLSNVKKVAQWKSKWKVWASFNGRIDVLKWESTLKSLRPLNGLVYNDGIGEVKFREEILKEVCKIVPPFHVWDDSHVQGRSRIGKLIQAKISKTHMSKKGVQVVGLYGMAGIGKTTACKSLCKDLHLEFNGRVCHIEFGNDTSEMDRVREVLKRLTNTDNKFLKGGSLEECWSRVKDILRLSKVVLAIDNVWDDFRIHDEVQKYLRLEYGQGSVVMVAARALGELEKLGIKIGDCLAMPELVEEEAKALFLHYVGLENNFDDEDVMECMSRCYFGKGDGDGSKHYHPLALRVLGSQMVGRHPSEWKSQLKAEDVFNPLQEDGNPVFSVLRRSFDSLKYEYKMLFMDVALFDDEGDLRNLKTFAHSYALDYDSRFIDDQRLSWYTIFEWLSIVHGTSVEKVKEWLNVLKKRALLEELGDGTCKIGMHDLWREFAIMETKRGEEKELQWVYEEHVSRGQGHAESCMSGGGWKNLRRIFIRYSMLGSMNFSQCSEVRVLRLRYVYVGNGALDLSHLKSIKSLEIVLPGHCVSVRSDEASEHIKVSGIGPLLDLAVLVWLNIDDESMSAVKEISCLTSLQILHLKWDSRSDYKSSISLDLQELSYLQDVRIGIPGMVSISGLSSRMQGLRILDLAGCHKLRSCAGVGNVYGLEVLLLSGCWKLEELPNLQNLRRLRILDIHGCKLLKALPGLRSLVALQVLYGGNACLAMKELPSMRNLAKLEVLDLRRCWELKCIPGLGNLVALRELGVHCGCLHGLPDLRNLTKLQKVEICGSNSDDCKAGFGVSGNVLDLAILEFVPTLKIDGVDHELSNMSKLTALKSLVLKGCNFERLPHMGSDMILESLTIQYCGRFVGWDNVRGLETGPDSQVDTSSDWTLSYLKEIKVWNCKSVQLPDLGHFPHLRRLSLSGWDSRESESTELIVHCHAIHVHLETLDISDSPIRELPDLGNFPSLRSVKIFSCHKLTNLAISEPLSTLSQFKLCWCANLHMALDTALFPSLTEFAFQDLKQPLNGHEVQKLIARGFRDGRDGTFMLEPSSDVVLPPASELKCHAADERVAVAAPNNLAAGSSRLEPCTSEFIPHSESLSEFGKISVSKRALKLGSSSIGSDQEQTKNLKNTRSFCGWNCFFIAFLHLIVGF